MLKRTCIGGFIWKPYNYKLCRFTQAKGYQVWHMKDYKAIFEKVESTLISIGSANLSADRVRANLDEFKHLEGTV